MEDEKQVKDSAWFRVIFQTHQKMKMTWQHGKQLKKARFKIVEATLAHVQAVL